MKILFFVTITACLLTYSGIASPRPVTTGKSLQGNNDTSLHRLIQLAAKNGGVLNLEAGKTYKGDIILPSFHTGTNIQQFIINGNNAVLEGSIRRLCPSQEMAENLVNGKLIVRNLSFRGRGKGTALSIEATYGSVIEDCSFTGYDTAIAARFCLAAYIARNFFLQVKGIHILLVDGHWKGASGSNSQSNQSILELNRHYC